MTREIKIGNVRIGGNNPLVLIAGPCVIEGERSTLRHANKIKKISQLISIPFIFKASYDKANRTSISSYRGPGLKEGLRILKKIKREIAVPVLSDVHSVDEIKRAAEVLDIIQIPAFLSRQTDLIIAAAKTKKPINIKKGQFLAPWDLKNVVEKAEKAGNRKIMITERGTSFGYNNLVSDLRSLQILRSYGYPIIYDATHSIQLPGGAGKSSSGSRQFVPGLSRAAVAMGCDGLFLEVHENPRRALSDGPNMLYIKNLEDLLIQTKEIDHLIKYRV